MDVHDAARRDPVPPSRQPLSVEYHPPVGDWFVVLVIVLVVVLVWRGPKTLPQIGNMLGRGVKEARREAAELRRRDNEPPANQAE